MYHYDQSTLLDIGAGSAFLQEKEPSSEVPSTNVHSPLPSGLIRTVGAGRPVLLFETTYYLVSTLQSLLHWSILSQFMNTVSASRRPSVTPALLISTPKRLAKCLFSISHNSNPPGRVGIRCYATLRNCHNFLK